MSKQNRWIEEAGEITNRSWQRLDEVKKAQNLPAIQKGLERLKNDRTWQSVEEVDAFIDELIAICKKIG